MAVYHCPICNEKFYIDNVEEAGETIPCNKCGSLIRTAQLEAYAQKTQEIDAEELWVLQKKQLEALESIRSMLKFFTTLTVIGIVFSVITAMLMMY